MCGKFTQMATWAEVVAFSQAFTLPKPRESGAGGGEDEAVITATPMRFAHIVRLNDEGARETVPMRWGFTKAGAATPRPDYMHARAETIDTRPTFRESFARRRGLCFVRTFNEGEEVGKKTVQWTVTPKDGRPLAIAVIYEEWVNGDQRLFTFVQVTTPPNPLIATITDRMPAIIAEEHHALWLGEDRAPLSEVKAILQPYDDKGGWDFAPEPKKPRAKK
ncbi:MAG: SOS response-associated peptidase family protein [Hyphomicrobiaceae bacterium]|nr:SOS response-associated peptidase family protein [Hyphomicrobiaceae bacterium]